MTQMTAPRFANSIEAASYIFQVSQTLPGGRKFDNSDMTQELADAALIMAQGWTNMPTHWANNFMLDMKAKGHKMNDAQRRGVLNVIRAEQKKALEAVATDAAPAPAKLNVAKVKTARFRVVQPDDKSISVRLSIPTMWTDAPKGTRKVSAMVSGSWVAVGKVDPDGTVNIWKKTGQDLTERVMTALTTLANADDDLVYILAYAIEGHTCGFCGLELDTEESNKVGYGPKCAKVHGLPWGEKAVPAKVLLAKAGLLGPISTAKVLGIQGDGTIVRAS